MTQEEINDVMWQSLPQWRKDQLMEFKNYELDTGSESKDTEGAYIPMDQR